MQTSLDSRSSDLYSRVSNYVKRLSTGFLLYDTVLGVLVGGIIGAMVQGPHSGILWFFMIVLGSLWLASLVIQVSNQRDFPAAAIAELRASSELDKLNRSVERKIEVDRYIESAVEALNDTTCSLTPEKCRELCEMSTAAGATRILRDLIAHPEHLLACSNLQFTVGAYVQQWASQGDGEHAGSPARSLQSAILRDNLAFTRFLSSDLLSSQTATGVAFELKTALERSYNNKGFSQAYFSHDKRSYTIVASPVLDICRDDEPLGVLFIVADQLDHVPEDVGNLLLIFTRILANWLSKYNDCTLCKLQKRGCWRLS